MAQYRAFARARQETELACIYRKKPCQHKVQRVDYKFGVAGWHPAQSCQSC